MKSFKNIYGECTGLLTVSLTIGLFLVGIPLIFLPLKPQKKRQKPVEKDVSNHQVLVPTSSQIFVISQPGHSPSKFQLQTSSDFPFKNF